MNVHIANRMVVSTVVRQVQIQAFQISRRSDLITPPCLVVGGGGLQTTGSVVRMGNDPTAKSKPKVPALSHARAFWVRAGSGHFAIV